MDTPYRLVKTLKELWEMTLWKEKKTKGTWQCSLALDLFSSQEEIWRGSPDDLWLRIQKANQTKRQFVLVIYRKRIHGEKDERTKKTSEKKIIQKTTFEKKGRPEEKRSSVTRKKSTGRVWKKR
jgi:16S rRNA C1402 (ribose-2'-O) methylase RsmI